mmetsp:Transcript_5450/g.11592  ORF Transcript_5450/g.11592 Transcript_5450/m.11592 type:complete len:574 (+) Transcript_5450:91-1812(+)
MNDDPTNTTSTADIPGTNANPKSNTMATLDKITPITPKDTIHVHGKHLYRTTDTTSTPFTIRGIAFPTPPEIYNPSTHGYNATTWLAILRQLRLPPKKKEVSPIQDSNSGNSSHPDIITETEAQNEGGLGLNFNTIRLYRMYPDQIDYSEFLEGAAALGIYVIVPLTSAFGHGVLDRTSPAPKCYHPHLFHYGARALKKYLKYPNVLAGMVGNEVMNDEKAWKAAPCVRAYARDLKLYMARMVEEGVLERTLPLMYAGQDSSMIGGADTDPNEVMKLTVDYLSCVEYGKSVVVVNSEEDVDVGSVSKQVALRASGSAGGGSWNFEDHKFGESPIDIFGLNVESWCSSTQTFEYNSDGTIGTYYSLWKALKKSSVPIIFSEMGCPHSHFDRDDLERKTKEGTRDWKQVEVVSRDMADSWSGFVAYTYDGPEDFVMFKGGPWDGQHVLEPTKDFENFRKELAKVTLLEDGAEEAGIRNDYSSVDSKFLPRQCSDVESELMGLGVRLFNDDEIRSYAMTEDSHYFRRTGNLFWIMAFILVGGFTLVMRRNRRARKIGYESVPSHGNDGYPMMAGVA